MGEAAMVLPAPLEPAERIALARDELVGREGYWRLNTIRALAHGCTNGERSIIALALYQLALEQVEREARAALMGQEAHLVEAALAGYQNEWKVTGLHICCVCLEPRRIGGQEVSALYTCGKLPCGKVWRLLRPAGTRLRAPYKARKAKPKVVVELPPPGSSAAPITRKDKPGRWAAAKPGRCGWCVHPSHTGLCHIKQGRGLCKCPPGGSGGR